MDFWRYSGFQLLVFFLGAHHILFHSKFYTSHFHLQISTYVLNFWNYTHKRNFESTKSWGRGSETIKSDKKIQISIWTLCVNNYEVLKYWGVANSWKISFDLFIACFEKWRQCYPSHRLSYSGTPPTFPPLPWENFGSKGSVVSNLFFITFDFVDMSLLADKINSTNGFRSLYFPNFTAEIIYYWCFFLLYRICDGGVV